MASAGRQLDDVINGGDVSVHFIFPLGRDDCADINLACVYVGLQPIPEMIRAKPHGVEGCQGLVAEGISQS